MAIDEERSEIYAAQDVFFADTTEMSDGGHGGKVLVDGSLQIGPDAEGELSLGDGQTIQRQRSEVLFEESPYQLSAIDGTFSFAYQVMNPDANSGTCEG
jgi:hypothetical protein